MMRCYMNYKCRSCGLMTLKPVTITVQDAPSLTFCVKHAKKAMRKVKYTAKRYQNCETEKCANLASGSFDGVCYCHKHLKRAVGRA